MKISNPFYSFYAIFFALAMLNAPPDNNGGCKQNGIYAGKTRLPAIGTPSPLET